MTITDQMLQEHLENTGHALFGPSSLTQRRDCPASALEAYKYGPQPSSEWAAAGTELHDHMEQAGLTMVGGGDGLSYLNNLEIEEQRRGWLLDSWDYLQTYIAKHPPDATILFEADVSLKSFGVPEVTGTADVVIRSADRIDVIDWKFGQGVPVFAANNLQGACYAAGAIGFPIPDLPIYIHIAQAPLESFTRWDVTPKELENLMVNDVFDIVLNGRQNTDQYGPSMSACRFCPVKMSCTARLNHLEEGRQLVLQAAENKQMIESQMIKLLDFADDIQQAIKDVRKHAAEVIQNGGTFGDYKMVAGRGSRRPIDKEEYDAFLISELGDKAYKPREVLSIAQAEKAKPGLKKDSYFKELWEKVPGKPVLVKGTDKRKAIAYGVASHFQKFIGEN